MFDKQRKIVTKAVYSTLGAPVVARKVADEYAGKFTKYTDRVVEHAQSRYDESAQEGEKIAKRLQDGNVVEEIQTRVDMDKVQDRVGKLRDQLEAALESWRENFAPDEATEPPKKVAVEEPKKTGTAKPAAKKTTAKPATAKKTTAAKKTTTKTTPAKTTAAKKTTATKKTTASK